MSGAAARKRWIMLALAALLALVLGLGATLAWQSNTQVRLNSFKNLYLPNANLHDDYIAPEGAETYTLRPNKDVYVENSGNTMVYLRVRLTEYLETQDRGSLVEGHERNEAMANRWVAHNAAGSTVEECFLPPAEHVSYKWEGEYFHDYYRWVMGSTATPQGQIYYKPATAEQKGSYDAAGNLLTEPTVVTDPNAAVSPLYNPAQLYAQQVRDKQAEGSTEAQAMTALGLQKTLPTRVITMQDWVNGSPEQGVGRLPIGNMWVIDEKDGWCYWASPLRAGEATGLLLDGVQRTDKPFDSTAEYCINVVLQAVDLDEIGKLWSSLTGGATAEGETLLKIISGMLVLGEDNEEYINNGDGSYKLKTPKEGQDPRSFVPLVVPSVNAPDRFYLGQRFTVDGLLWDGNDYTNWESVLATTTQPLYNITPVADADTEAIIATGTPVYQLIGSEIGWDGNIYLQVARVELVSPAVEASLLEPIYLPGSSYCYLGSLSAEPKNSQALADPWENPNAKLTYSRVYPGNGPYGFLWRDTAGEITLPEDPNLNVGGRYFEHLGNGAYVEVVSASDPTPLAPEVYCFGTKPYTKAAIDGTPGNGQQQLDNFFHLQLDTGRYDVTFDPAVEVATEPVTDPNPTKHRAAVASYTNNGFGSYTAKLAQGANGKQYLDLGDMGYLATGSDEFLGNKGDWRVWHGADGIIGTDDDTYMGEFTEPFLRCIAKAELDVGGTLKADGYEWVVIGTDDKGNRLIMSTTSVASMGARWNKPSDVPVYAGTYWPTRATTFVNKLTTLKPYARTATLPAEPRYPFAYTWDAISPDDGLSAVTTGSTGYLTFPLSAGEHVKYILNSTNATFRDTYKVVRNSAGVAHPSGLRSLHTAGTPGVALSVGGQGQRYDAFANTDSYHPRMAMWVRFSDCPWEFAEESFLVGKTSDDLVPGKSFATGDITGTDDREGWMVMAIDKYGNRFIVHKNPYSSVAGRNPYKGSEAEARMKKEYTTTMPNLKPYIMGTTTPVETGAYSPTRNEAGALSAAIYDKSSATIFVPSQSEFTTYKMWEQLPYHSSSSALQTRSPGKSGYYVCIRHVSSLSGDYYEIANTNTSTRPYAIAGCWVRFGDADKIATATPAELTAWKNGAP